MPRAVVNGTVLAEADRTVVAEGNHSFPPGSLEQEHLRDATPRPWTDVARDHDVVAVGVAHLDAGWSHPRPSPLARRVGGRGAVDRRTAGEPSEHVVPRPRLIDRLRRRDGGR